MKSGDRLSKVENGSVFEASGREVLSIRDKKMKLTLVGAFQMFAILIFLYVMLSVLKIPVQNDPAGATILVGLIFSSIGILVVSLGFMLYFRMKGSHVRSYRIVIEGRTNQGDMTCISYSDGRVSRNHVEVAKVRPYWGIPLFVKVGQISAAAKGFNSSMMIEIVNPAYNLYLGFQNDNETKRAYDSLQLMAP